MNETFSLEDKALVWKELSRRELLKTAVYTVSETTSVASDGKEGHYIVTTAPDWCIVIPSVKDEMGDDFLMVKQWRHAHQGLSIEFPGGVMEAGEDAAVGGSRELLEETGYRARKMTFLGVMNPNPALFSNRVHVYLAEDLEKEGQQSLDADERLSFFRLAKSEVIEKMGTADYPHALMTAALGLYRESRKNILIEEGLYGRRLQIRCEADFWSDFRIFKGVENRAELCFLERARAKIRYSPMGRGTQENGQRYFSFA